jgi:DNA-binding NtrC family response regulator
MNLPRILVIDDLLGRAGRGQRNRDRYDFCLRLGLIDVTGDEAGEPQKIDRPLAEAVFCRGQIEEDGVVRNDVDQVLRVIEEGWSGPPVWALVFLDLLFKTGRARPDGEPEGAAEDRDPASYFGLQLLERIKAKHSELPVVVGSAEKRDPVEQEMARRLANDFRSWDTLTPRALTQLLEEFGLIEDDRLIIRGRSKALLTCLRDARRAARLGTINILLVGEPGSGKELVARYLHDKSPKSKGPYHVVSLHGIPDTLIEAELFGYEAGAFADAIKPKIGHVELADGGTLVIDEFHRISHDVQVKLLRFLEEDTRQIERLGPNVRSKAGRVDSLTKHVDLQVVLATNDLEIRKSLREDVRRRVPWTEEIRLPPLRERLDEIPELATYLTQRAEDDLKHAGVNVMEGRSIEAEAIEELRRYSWPSNVGELRSVLRSVVRKYPRIGVVSAMQIREALARAYQ